MKELLYGVFGFFNPLKDCILFMDVNGKAIMWDTRAQRLRPSLDSLGQLVKLYDLNVDNAFTVSRGVLSDGSIQLNPNSMKGGIICQD